MQAVAALPAGNAPPGFAAVPLPTGSIAPTMPGAPMLVPVPGMAPGLPPPPGAGLLAVPGVPGGMLSPLPGPPMTGGATVSIAIDNLPFRYQLSEADLRETFQRWGAIQSVQVMRDSSRDVGAIQFADQVDAQDAQKQLTGQSVTLDGSTGTLAVVMGSPYQLLGQRPGPPGATGPVTVPPGPGAPKNGGQGLAKGDGKGLPGDGYARPVWCCKIIVEAESLHPEFPTVLRIRGEGDANVDHIRTQTKCNVQLRGTGSGTTEPESNQELQEPMFLWLTSDSVENGKASLEMTLDLLKSIYEGHQQWCEQNSIMHPDFVKPKVIENPEVLPGVGNSAPQVVPVPMKPAVP